MSKHSQEVISLLHKNFQDVYLIGCELESASKRIPDDYTYRLALNPDAEPMRLGPGYVLNNVYPKRVDGGLNMWSGVLIEPRVGRRVVPDVLGFVCVRPSVVVRLETDTKKTVTYQTTLVDAWTRASNGEHDDALFMMFERGIDVARKLYPKQPISVVEPFEKDKNAKSFIRPRTFPIIASLFPREEHVGKIIRPDRTKTVIRDGKRRAYGMVRSVVR